MLVSRKQKVSFSIIFRCNAQEAMEHPFLCEEPEVSLLSVDKLQLNFQVVFKGSDKLSVKFEFNVESDTAEQVVKEMVFLSLIVAD